MPPPSLLLLVTAATLLGACRHPQLVPAPSCLGGPLPQTGRPEADERIALMRREWTRAWQSAPLVRSLILESLPPLSPGLSDLFPAPRCEDELRRTAEQALVHRPLPFSRLLVAHLRLARGSTSLLGLAGLPDDAITPYQAMPEEPGPLPPKSLVRAISIAEAPLWWSGAPEAERRLRLVTRLRASRDDRELLLLQPAASVALGASSPVRLRAWLTDIERRLLGPAERPSLELVLLRLVVLVDHGERLGLGPEVRALVERLVAAKGECPLTRGSTPAAHDLAELARWMLTFLDVPIGSLQGYSPPEPRRERFDPMAALASEPAGGHATLEQRRSRLRDLEGELAGLRMNASRCHVLEELGRWVPDEDAPQHFETLTAPIRQGTSSWSTETDCRLRVALDLEGAGEAPRVGFLLTLLSAAPDWLGPRDTSGDLRDSFHFVRHKSVLQAAALALGHHLDWIERHAPLREWLEAQALAPIPTEAEPAQTWRALQPAFERLVDFHLSGGPGARPEKARELLHAWMQSIRAAEGARVGHVYLGEVVDARLRALGALGRRAGLAGELTAFLRGRESWRSATVAAYLLTLSGAQTVSAAR